MSKNATPWGVLRLSHMISPDVQTQTQDGRWVRAVPAPYRKNIREAIRAAWWVLTGRAEAVVWPKPGEFEAAVSPAPQTRAMGITLVDNLPVKNGDCGDE